MSSVTWRYLSGNTATFAIELSLISDTSDDWMVDADERATWGALALWIGGVNVCEHVMQGERLQFAHWYLLPIVEWLVDQWDPLLHEERIPIEDAGVNAARGFARAATLIELEAGGKSIHDPDAIQSWYARHGLRASAPGAILPDLYVRRYGDRIEFSTGSEPLAGQDWGVVFTEQAAYRVPVSEVSAAFGAALEKLATEFLDRGLISERFVVLADAINKLRNPEREHSRFAWLSGAGDRVHDFDQLWNRVRAEIKDVTTLGFDDSASVGGGLATLAPPAALLFGSLAPDVSADDIIDIYGALVSKPDLESVAEDLGALGNRVANSWDGARLSPGEQGSLCGQAAWNWLADYDAPMVDIENILMKLGIEVDRIHLRDRTTRAVSLLNTSGSAHILVNENFQLGNSRAVERFTLAHELAHLLLDQDRAARMVVASGPWAPTEIEQRANAFAAAFLIPTPLLDATWISPTRSPLAAEIRSLALKLGVSFTALTSRLQNLGRISSEVAEALRSE